MKFIISTLFAKIRILKIRVLNSSFSNSFLGEISIFHLQNPTSPPVLEVVVLIFVFYMRDEFGKSRVRNSYFQNTNFRKHCSWIYSVFVILINIVLNCTILNFCIALYWLWLDALYCFVMYWIVLNFLYFRVTFHYLFFPW